MIFFLIFPNFCWIKRCEYISAFFVNEASQSSDSNLVILSKQCSRELSLPNFKLKMLSFIRVLEYFPLSEFLHSLSTGDHGHILQIVVVEASFNMLDVLLVSTCKNAVLPLSAIVFLGLAFLIFDVNILDVSWFMDQNMKFFDLAAECLVAPLYRVFHLASSLLHPRISVTVLCVHQLALLIRSNWLLPYSTFRII